MRRFVLLVGILLGFLNRSMADPGTKTRDFLKESHPVYERMWTLLGITPLTRDAGKSVLRMWDEDHSWIVTVSGGTVTMRLTRAKGDAWGSLLGPQLGRMPVKPVPNAENLLETQKTDFTFADASFADDMRYLISRASVFDADTNGADGGSVFLDAVDMSGKFTTFEVWSPSDAKYPFASEICCFFWRFDACIKVTESSEQDWQNHDKWNFMTMFPAATGVNLTQVKAKGYVDRALKQRFQNLVSELRHH